MLEGSASCSERCLPVSSLARLCFRRRFVVLGAWILLLATLAVAALSVGTAFTNSTTLPNSESATAYTLLAEAGIGQSASGASTQSGEIVWHTTGAGISDATVRKDATDLKQWLNTTISYIKVNGELDAIARKWVGSPLPVLPTF